MSVKKVLSGALAFVPALYMVLWSAWLVWFELSRGFDGLRPDDIKRFVIVVFALNAFILPVLFGQLFYYGWRVLKAKHLKHEHKALWMVGLVFFSFFAIPLSWFKLVRRSPEDDAIAKAFE